MDQPQAYELEPQLCRGVTDRETGLQERIRAKLGKGEPATAAEPPGDDPPLPDDVDTLAAQLSEAEAEVER